MRALRLKFAATGAAIAVVGALIPGIHIAEAAENVLFEADGGIIKGFAPTGLAISYAEFLFTCPVMPTSQDIDGHVFDLGFDTPAGADLIASGVTESPLGYDLDTFFFDSSCTELGSSFETGTDEVVQDIPAGTHYVAVVAFKGINTATHLRVTTFVPDPDPTGEPTADPSPAGPRVPGVYSTTPNDPYFGTSEDDDVLNFTFEPTQWGMRKINAPQAWGESQATGFEIKVAVVDTGVDLEHPDLACADANGHNDWKLNVVPDSAFEGTVPGPDDENGHGTHVAGIIGACTNNGTGVVGIAPDSTIIPIQVLDAEGSGALGNIALGVRRAVDAGAHVINMSLGANAIGYTAGLAGPIDNFVGFNEMADALDYAKNAGVVVVASAGNDSLPFCGYPARYEGVVCVGATDPRDNRSWYSNGPKESADEPMLVAPGGTGQIDCTVYAEEIFSTWSTHEADPCGGLNGYISINGTSMASPHVAGVAALIYDRLGGVRSAANAQAVIDALIAGARDLGAPGFDPIFGAGRLDALASVLAVDVVPHPEPPVNVTP